MRLVATLCFLLSLAAVANAQVPDKCQAAKMKAVGKKTFDKAKCRAKALQKGVVVDPLCLTKAEDKFAKAITKADTLGSCPGTTTDLEAAVDQCVTDYVALLTAVMDTTTTTSIAGSTTTTPTTMGPTTTTTPATPCGSATYPQCGGTCPAGQTCYAARNVDSQGTTTTGCSCATTGAACACTSSALACPSGQACVGGLGFCIGCAGP